MAEDHPADPEQTVAPDEFATVPQPNAEAPRIWLARATGWPLQQGRYEFVRLLGKGAMYLARDLHSGRRVAVKIPNALRDYLKGRTTNPGSDPSDFKTWPAQSNGPIQNRESSRVSRALPILL